MIINLYVIFIIVVDGCVVKSGVRRVRTTPMEKNYILVLGKHELTGTARILLGV